jgi:ubiquinol-cytochrome c reductase iron-sulfur subunit
VTEAENEGTPPVDTDRGELERRAERRTAAGFGLCTVSAVGLAIVYWRGGQPQLEGLFLGLAFAGLAYGFGTWGRFLLPQGPFVQERHSLAASEKDREALEEELDSEPLIGRRPLLLRSMGLAGAAVAAAFLFPIRSLGPKPGRKLATTPWRDGLRLITDDGNPVRVVDVPVGGLVTVFPEGHPGSADGQAVLIRVEQGLIKPKEGREDWSPAGLIVYSKVCTHAGCPVGLLQAATHQLLCPCHQSAFDVLDAAKPVTGPAAAPLPQLPIRITPNGELVARGDFSEPVGPGYWRQT